MQLIRRIPYEVSDWSPFDQLFGLRNELKRLLDFSYSEGARPLGLVTGWVPTMDLFEDKDNLVARAELPGLKKKEIEISLQEGVLTISGERIREKEGDYHRSERFHGQFHRSLSLPKTVQADKVKATYKDGLLTVILPKTEEAKPKQIEVSDG